MFLSWQDDTFFVYLYLDLIDVLPRDVFYYTYSVERLKNELFKNTS